MVDGYRIVLPPGWVRIPLRVGTEEAMEEFVYSRTGASAPQGASQGEQMRHGAEVRRVLEEQIAVARGANGLDLYLPLSPRQRPVAASFLVSEVPPPGDRDRAHPEPGSTRREYVRPADARREVAVATRHVDYTLSVPGDPGRMLAVSFSTPGDGDPDSAFTDLLVELFDALMTTFRWTAGASASIGAGAG